MDNRLSTLFVQSRDPMLILDGGDFTILEANQRTQIFFGLSSEDLVGKSFTYISSASEEKIRLMEDQLKDHFLFINDDLFPDCVVTAYSFKDDNKSLVCLSIRTQKSDTYQTLFSKNVAGIYKIDFEGTILDCNPAFASILGYDLTTELIGTNVKKIYFKPEDREEYLAHLKSSNTLSNYEILLRKKDGSRVWCLENSFLERGVRGAIINGTLIDITEVKRATDKFQQLFDKSTDAILLIENGLIVDCNPQSEVIFGRTKSEILGVCPYHENLGFIPKDQNDLDLLQHKLSMAFKGESQRMSVICERGDESKFHAQWNISSFELDDKKYLQAIVRDVTDHVVFEEAIRESEERFKMLSDVAIESVVYVLEGKIVGCNDQFGKLLGFASSGAVNGKKLEDFINISDLERVRTTLEFKGNNKYEVRAKDRHKSTLFLEASGSYINYQGAKTEVYLFYDITARKRAEQALGQSIDRFKNLVENSPNGIFILTDYKIKYTNQSGIHLFGYQEEDDIFDCEFASFFDASNESNIQRIMELVREGEEVDYTEAKIRDRSGKEIDVGVKANLTVYENQPSIQVTVNNLSTRMLLIQEKVRAQLAEEINEILKREIEEHKNTQLKLIEAQNFTRNIIESSIDMIIAIDDQFNITEINAAAQKHFGYSEKDLPHLKANDLFGNKKEFQYVLDSLEETGVYSGEISNVKKDGQKFVSLLSASLIRNEAGDVLGSMGVSRDITEIKKAENELRESEERYRDLFENASDFILSLDKNGKFKYANNAFKNTLGYSENELKKKTIFDLVSATSIDKDLSLFDGFTGERLKVLFVAKNGSVIITEGSASTRSKNGKNHSIRGIFRDVTQTRQKEREALEQKAKLESIFDSTRNVMMWTLDSNYRVTTCNENFVHYMKEYHGLEMKIGAEFLQKIKEHVNKDLYQNQLKSFDLAFKGKPQEFELPLINSNGRPIWLQAFLNPVILDGKLEEISCLTYDITDRIEIDRKIRDSLKEKEVLLQEVHHRVKNNLQVISSILNLQSSYVTDVKTLEILSESQNRIKSMSYIHESLYQTADFSAVDFPDYLDTLVRNLVHSYSITSGHVEVIASYDEVALSLDQSIPCGLIINELVSNAMKYAYINCDEPKLFVELNKSGNKVSFLVADNGIGLPADFKYEESDSLGIQLVYTLVEQLDAELEVDSSSGTRFFISFDVP
ncbi:MAG: PAS domain S-box-containing protein [Flavobacteriales bacterium]|jgi:PAS domain S-box-containing protein